MRQPNPMLELACGEYDIAKREANGSQQITTKIIEKRLGLRPNQLRNYRANYLSRKTRLSPK